MSISRLPLLFVVLLDVMGQGLVIPVLTTILTDPAESILPPGTSAEKGQFLFGLTMGLFFLCWFFGAAFISKLSDFIGRRLGILICLTGAFVGYGLTICGLVFGSFSLVLAARMITGFTAGNQPIAQAALVDVSRNEEEKTRLMGFVVVAISLGLVAGPLIGGLFSSREILGQIASMQLPFYVAAGLVVTNAVLIVVFFREPSFVRRRPQVKITDVFLTLWEVTKRPVVLKVSAVFFCSQLALNSFFVFLDDYLESRFGFDTLQNSIILIVFGIAIAVTGAVIVGPITKHFPKRGIIYGTLVGMAAGLVMFLLNPIAALSYIMIVPFVVAWAVNYPVILTIFSGSVGPAEQGWVMGVTVALYTLGAGIISMVGGDFMAIDIRLPFLIAIGSVVLAGLLAISLWRGKSFKDLLSE